MKKLLSILGALGLTTTGVSSVVGCHLHKVAPQPNPAPSTKDDKIINKVESWSQAAPLLVNSKNFRNLTAHDVEKTISNQLPIDQTYQIKIKDSSFYDVKVDNNQLTDGTIIISILHNNKILVDKQKQLSEFNIKFTTQEISYTEKLVNDLNQKTSGSVENISDFQINFGETSLPLKLIMNLLPSLVKFNNLPTKIPTTFNQNDPVQRQWTAFVQQFANLAMVGDILKINFNQTFDSSGVKINISGNVGNIINAITPDLIHFHNFLIKQKDDKHRNLLLLLIQYLFATPQDINNDGFTKVDSGTTKITSNLDYLICDLLQPWKTEQGEKFGVNRPIAIDIVKYVTMPVYWDKWELTDIELAKVGITNVFKNTLNQLFNHDINKDITVDFSVSVLKEDIHLQLKPLIETSLPTFLLQQGYDENEVNNNISILSGTIKFESSTDGQTWLAANNLDDILKANVKDFQVKLDNLQFKVTSKADPTISFLTNKDLAIKINLDLTTDPLL
ncbi:hypothetical protein P344_00615 [Spiroplasma mirum ATCC 29335]|uniref:Lipoprotein n=1 Tax=Spiroplasma mirum ATCC 29335 TaxID=838561 RepID=W0GK78_9MOLU|nr:MULTISPECIES: lipoprotein [Spiroplasma]AHF60572.1 putative lipoprotein [Spiroplasma mirum ATCC 29335]AHI57496.1 hypothetical protein P344_00615 [Spiroplasma mirum ATCC 29335]AKM52690.1 hypothetical protein SATRI_v1c01050 [Spiroplasma atrichopogonis]